MLSENRDPILVQDDYQEFSEENAFHIESSLSEMRNRRPKAIPNSAAEISDQTLQVPQDALPVKQNSQIKPTSLRKPKMAYKKTTDDKGDRKRSK